MPTVVRKTRETLMEVRRGILHSVSWQVKSSIWDPPTDVYETEEVFVIRVEIAGMREENFDVSVQNDTLYITGFRHDFPAKRAVHQMEIRSGRFASVVRLSAPVDVEHALAEYQDGFLTITLPKETQEQG
ncbi:MAG: Hsp20/alpha crystallin family protein [Anaerolineales bacterium]|uniref:Hsp20/alpha crystallin family protein n=1 Tax=Candidatus Villigracilis vicinus TaxID=3140679 RepID=UPI003136B9CB|nr:Hsp20/alpha crystallin family protein [Anaerolineales bacterium]